MFEMAIANIGADYKATLDIDCAVTLEEITESLVTELGMLEPYGIGNPEPVLVAESVEVISKRIFKDKHIGLKVRQGGRPLDAVWFNAPDGADISGSTDLVFTPEFNVWNGRKEIRLKIWDAGR